MARIFISYRRRDSAYVASSLRDAIQLTFGAESVFFDIDNIPFGADFREHIGNAVGQCDVLLVLIGDQWLQSTDDQGQRRIEDPSDYVRIEIESALKRKIPVVPVLVGEAKMPAASEIPEAIRDMVFRNAAEIRATRDQKNQIERLVEGLATHFQHDLTVAAKEEPTVAKSEHRRRPETRKRMSQRKPPELATAEPEVDSGPVKTSPAISSVDLEKRAAFLKNVASAFKGIRDAHLCLKGSIPPQKAVGAIKSYAPDVPRDTIMLLYDNTVWGGAKNGFLLTLDAIYWHNSLGNPGCSYYSNIRSAIITIKNHGATLQLNKGDIELSQGPYEKIVRALQNLLVILAPPNVRKVAKQTLEAKASAAIKPMSAMSQAELDRQMAFVNMVHNVFEGIRYDSVWIIGAIPPEKAKGATQTYAPKVSPESVVVLYDATVWGGAQDGFLLTVDGIYWRNFAGSPGYCPYTEMRKVEVKSSPVSLRINTKDITTTEPIGKLVVKLIRTLNPPSLAKKPRLP